jgi:hypothetical protein
VKDVIDAAGKSINRITSTVAKIERIRSENAMSAPDLTRLIGYFFELASEYITDQEQLTEYRRCCGLFRWASGTCTQDT